MYNVAGAVLWVAIGLAAGHWFGNLPIVEENFTLVIVAIVLISVAPVAFETVRHRLSR
jgi:membrane-associated protein